MSSATTMRRDPYDKVDPTEDQIISTPTSPPRTNIVDQQNKNPTITKKQNRSGKAWSSSDGQLERIVPAP